MDRRARFACIACRRLKRKCPKELPSCSLCVRLEKRCEYPPRARNLHENTSHESTSSESSNRETDVQLLGDPSTELHLAFRKGAVPGRGDIYAFPAMYFLDSEVCIKPLSSDSAQPVIPTPPSNGLSSEVLTVCEKYFSTIHQWLPILSKKRVRRHIAENGSAPDCPSHLLFLCMKLVSELLPSEIPARANKTYMQVLETLLRVENSRLPCLQLLQSVILISIYEIGHAIYPAAYLRVGHASRLCIMMGFHDQSHVMVLTDSHSQPPNRARVNYYRVLSPPGTKAELVLTSPYLRHRSLIIRVWDRSPMYVKQHMSSAASYAIAAIYIIAVSISASA
ncbi:hypothetical protein M434DRAFT_236786 [Hypoxylon sp. CO27-5]|nr:hypothetical protein M434DRAFT_236786 [Hypoxylon sp. CO27-5]